MKAPTYLGSVQEVQGSTVAVALEATNVSGLVFLNGKAYRVGQMGSYVRIPMGFSDLFGVVTEVGAGAVPASRVESEPYGYRWMRVQLVGEAQRLASLQRGVSQYPTIGDEVHLVIETDLKRIYGTEDARSFVRVGSVAGADGLPAFMDLNRLVSRHSAVLGSTGAGKSTTVAGFLNNICSPDSYPSSRVIVFDIHGEYAQALSNSAKIFAVNPRQGNEQLYVPYWALKSEELLEIISFGSLRDADRAGVLEKLRQLKISSLRTCSREGTTIERVTVDTPVPFSIHRFWYELYRLVSSTHTALAANQSQDTEAIEADDKGPMLGDVMRVVPPKYRPITQGGNDRVYMSGSPLNIRRQVEALGAQLRDTRFDFLFRPGPWCPQSSIANLDAQPPADLDAWLASWLGSDKPVVILDLSGVPSAVLSALIGALVRIVFDALVWGRYLREGGRNRPLLLVLEEAHTYLQSSDNGSALTAVQKVVKEGRKYGLSAMLVSQRPSEIDETVLSQCGTIMAMRMGNPADRARVTATVSDNLDGLFDMLPVLRTGEAIIVGEAVQVPTRVTMDLPPKNRRPDSDDPTVVDVTSSPPKVGWTVPRESEDYAQVLTNWREEKALRRQEAGSE